MIMAEAAMATKVPVQLDLPTDARIMQIWEVIYQDFRVDGLSSVLFRYEATARAFATRHDARAVPQWVTLAEFMRLRKQRRL